MQYTKIYSVFPACGKTWLCEHQEDYGLKILDSDSSEFSWIWDEKAINGEHIRYKVKRNPAFPDNYIQHIKDMIETGLYDCIFVSSHASVRKVLDQAGLDFAIVYPDDACKAEWIGRCYIRDKQGESGCNPDVLYDNWDNWIIECVETGIDHNEIVLKHGEHLSNLFV